MTLHSHEWLIQVVRPLRPAQISNALKDMPFSPLRVLLRWVDLPLIGYQRADRPIAVTAMAIWTHTGEIPT
jgi:hypothetical protein